MIVIPVMNEDSSNTVKEEVAALWPPLSWFCVSDTYSLFDAFSIFGISLREMLNHSLLDFL